MTNHKLLKMREQLQNKFGTEEFSLNTYKNKDRFSERWGQQPSSYSQKYMTIAHSIIVNLQAKTKKETFNKIDTINPSILVFSVLPGNVRAFGVEIVNGEMYIDLFSNKRICDEETEIIRQELASIAQHSNTMLEYLKGDLPTEDADEVMKALATFGINFHTTSCFISEGLIPYLEISAMLGNPYIAFRNNHIIDNEKSLVIRSVDLITSTSYM
jgi:hypothetical protein